MWKAVWQGNCTYHSNTECLEQSIHSKPQSQLPSPTGQNTSIGSDSLQSLTLIMVFVAWYINHCYCLFLRQDLVSKSFLMKTGYIAFCNLLSWQNCRITEWFWLKGTLKTTVSLLCQTEIPSTAPSCLGSYPIWAWTFPGKGHPQLLWAVWAILSFL